MKPLYMWAGGKKKMLSKYKPYLPSSFKNYHEPFFGGGAMFIWAYENSPKSHFYINDINPHLMDIYRNIKADPKSFIQKLEDLQADYLPLSIPSTDKEDKKKNKELEKGYKEGAYVNWHDVYRDHPSRRSFYFSLRDQYQNNYSQWSSLEESAVLYFLMKTGFNGVWQLSKKNGRFNTPCGLMTQEGAVFDKSLIMNWHEALQNTTITSVDYADTLQNVAEGDYVFLDPPYRSGDDEKTFADYGTRLDDEFQEDVVNYLKSSSSKGAYSMLSNRELGDDFFTNLCSDTCNIHTFDVSYTVGRRKRIEDAEGKPILDDKGKEQFQEAKKAKEVLIIGK